MAEPPPFVMLLRKHLEGTRLRDVRQPRWERLLEIGFARGQTEPHVLLVVEVMGRISNVILKGADGVILGALRLVGEEQNRYRSIAPHVPYRYPPGQTRLLRGMTLPRLDPETLTGSDLAEAAADTSSRDGTVASKKRKSGPSVASLLMGHVAGWSRDLAAEAAARAGLSPDVEPTNDVTWDTLAVSIRELAALADGGEWAPTFVYEGDDRTVRDAAVYRPKRFGDAPMRGAPSVNELLATYFEGAEWRGAVEGAKASVRRVLESQRERCHRKAAVLANELSGLGEAAQIRIEADILLAFQSDVTKGASAFTVENPFATKPDDPDSLTIALDPSLNAVQNANRLYTRYHKLQRAAEMIPPQIEANDVELARVEQLLTDLALAETSAEIALVRAEVVEAGYMRGASTRSSAGHKKSAGKPGKGKQAGVRKGPDGGAPLRRHSSDGIPLLIGKNSRQNEAVTFHEASGNDLWLHARGVPGAHVIVKSGGRPVPQATLDEAAALAAFYSQAREAGSVPVDYTQQRYVRHMKGGGPGMVIYERERTLHVIPRDAGAV